MIKINIHSSLVRFTNNENQIELAIDKTSSIIPNLCEHYEQLKNNILDKNGALSPFINIYVNGKNINQLDDISLQHSDTIDIVTALVGG